MLTTAAPPRVEELHPAHSAPWLRREFQVSRAGMSEHRLFEPRRRPLLGQLHECFDQADRPPRSQTLGTVGLRDQRNANVQPLRRAVLILYEAVDHLQAYLPVFR